ncbi:EpsG family protein [Photobacterium damselae]|uniref:EpsG family protein n=1 Tax=Photobacterium damselae TaxID=38293 RepID=UPI0013028AAF|nr:EpsG family protein [Photobacterium damselae]
MIVYYIANLFLFPVGYGYKKSNSQLRLLILFLLSTVYSLFFGLRYQVGVDWKNYITAFEFYNSNQDYFSLEVGYKILNIISYNLGYDIQFIIIITTLIVFFLSFYSLYFIKINPCYYIGVVFPYFIVMGAMNYTRQGVALSFFLLALSFLFNNKRVLFVIFLLFGCTFHVSLIIFLPLLFYRMKKSYLISIFLVLAIPFILLVNFQYSMYIQADFDSKGLLLRSAFVILSSVVLFLNRRVWDNSKYSNIYYVSMLSPVFVFTVSIVSTTMADRISYYFILLSALCCFLLCQFNGIHFKKYIVPLLFICSLTVFIIWSNFSSYIPYYEFKSQVFSGIL